MRHLIVRSRNTSCAPLRELIVPITTVYRMGSTTPIERILRNPNRQYIEINSTKACRISGNKLLMKQKFDEAGVNHAKWVHFNNNVEANHFFRSRFDEFNNKIIAKKFNSSRGNGLALIQSYDDYLNLKHSDDITQYIFEEYYNYTREYRIHVTDHGYFYASRKMLRGDAEVRWHRHSNNSIFYNEDNPEFNKPNTWDEITRQCILAKNAIGLDICAFDIKVNRNGDFILLESNSAPSLKEQGIEKYKVELKRLIDEKISQL